MPLDTLGRSEPGSAILDWNNGHRRTPMIEPILIVGIAIACTAWYMQHIVAAPSSPQEGAASSQPGSKVLAARYARGEITRAEYLQKRDDILASYAGGAQQFGGCSGQLTEPGLIAAAAGGRRHRPITGRTPSAEARRTRRLETDGAAQRS